MAKKEPNDILNTFHAALWNHLMRASTKYINTCMTSAKALVSSPLHNQIFRHSGAEPIDLTLTAAGNGRQRVERRQCMRESEFRIQSESKKEGAI